MILDPGIFLRGIAIGVIVAAPVGPVALALMRATIRQGRAAGFALGLGATGADAAYAALAAFGIAAMSHFLVDHQSMLRLIGGVIMLALAVIEWNAKPPDPTRIREARSLPGSFALGFAMAFTNPLTVIGFTGVFVAFGLTQAVMSLETKWLLVTGIVLGSAGWWLSLALIIGRTHRLLSPKAQRGLNYATAILLGILGLYALLTALVGPILFDPVSLQGDGGAAPAEPGHLSR